MSRALALESAYNLKRAKGWSYVSLTAHKVKGDPFWKTVRPDGVRSLLTQVIGSITPTPDLHYPT